jgi:hypothetical protein
MCSEDQDREIKTGFHVVKSARRRLRLWAELQVLSAISSLGVGFIMELIRVFQATIRWSISIPEDVCIEPASTSCQKR